jgi:N-acetylglucosaminyldiphosphoundecaprenol N-acetyl-beta-D-mannosaminyltransferase
MGRKITFMTIPAIINRVIEVCQQKSKITIASTNIHSFNLSLHLPWFYEYMRKADIVRCDGMGILKAVKILGLDLALQYQAAGTHLVPALIAAAEDHKWSFFLLGTKPEILDLALERLHDRYPDLEVSGHHGYFDKDDPAACAAVVAKINQAKPNILIVGMGMPVQEKWVYEYGDRLDVNVIMPCGAVIDRLAGLVGNSPAWVSRSGLEWLYRLAKEPKRLASRYLIGNPAFALQLALASTYSSPLEVKDAAEPQGSANLGADAKPNLNSSLNTQPNLKPNLKSSSNAKPNVKPAPELTSELTPDKATI